MSIEYFKLLQTTLRLKKKKKDKKEKRLYIITPTTPKSGPK